MEPDRITKRKRKKNTKNDSDVNNKDKSNISKTQAYSNDENESDATKKETVHKTRTIK